MHDRQHWKVAAPCTFMFLLLLIGLAIGLIPGQAPLPRSEIVDLTYAQYQGVSLYNGVDQFLGMRYARPPVKGLRWRAPQDPEQSDDVQDAISFGPLCPGVSQALSDTVAEDCLFVNVWRPKNASVDSNFPVWVFIQGGGYATLANANFNGSDVVHQSGNGLVNGDLNAGLLDQRKLFNWVQQHIRSFGGNPDRVVIHGDSAGAGAVAHHLAAYGGMDMNLFVGAVAESSFWPTTRTVSGMELQFRRFSDKVGCGHAHDRLSCLRGVDMKTIQKNHVNAPFPGGSGSPVPLWYFLPVVDGDLIPDRLYRSFKKGEFIHVPIMVTDDSNEGTGFAYDATSSEDVSRFLRNNYPGLGDDQLEQIEVAYPSLQNLPGHGAYFPLAAAAYGESTFTCPGNYIAASVSKFFSSDHVWNYRCNIRDPTEISEGMGVPHVFELPAIFGLNATNQAADSLATTNAAIVPVVMSYYISFVKSLNPNKFRYETAPVWNSWGNGTGHRLRVQTNATAMEVIPWAQAQRCSMWRALAAHMEQ
ncbi:hypothetical protein N7468_008755 [Penicillium chermesinum]|uniref:Carboxylic ester hydrolase n=1 Tax=Penicillium chermesinum TaxID=63820 RepID=A0A9W9NGQ1_9EURO|nr:uncharacterized protein N7468_008755 [Penicillium chermesinum]KAJ5219551.1 hypothetical protein N7468_008755 [Penicillium chermesinum]